MERTSLVKDALPITDKYTRLRFEEKLSICTDTDECWLWLGSRNSEGYGNFGVDGKTEKAHRASYRIYRGRIPYGLVIMHSCDNPSCVNPRHLKPGTHQENTIDKYMKGRANHARGERTGVNQHPDRVRRGPRLSRAGILMGKDHWTFKKPDRISRGMRCCKAKLTDADVIEMRRLFADGTNCHVLAKKYGILANTAYSAVTGDTWTHLPGATPWNPKNRTWNAKGASVNTAKLKDDDIRAIRKAYAETRKPTVIAAKYNVTRGTIHRIVTKQSWGHVND